MYSLNEITLVEVILVPADWSQQALSDALPPEPAPVPWHLPKKYLSAVSSWFESACKPEWQQNKAKPGTIQLDEVRPSTFSLFVEWLNGRKLVGRDGEPYNVELITDTPFTGEQVLKGRAFCREIMSLYQFADQYDIPQLRRDIMDICYRHLNLDLFIGTGSKQVILPTPALITDAYESLPSSSSMITWIIDVIAIVFSLLLQHGHVLPNEWEACPKDLFI
jgi:hypothetical protein